MARRRLNLVKRKAGGARGLPPQMAIEVRDVWLETPIGDGWTAAFRLFEQAGDLVVGELRIYPHEPEDGDPDSAAYLLDGMRPAGQWSAEMLGDKAPVPPGGLKARKAREARFDTVRESARELLTRVRLDDGVAAEELFEPGGLLAQHRIDPSALERSVRGRRSEHDDAFLASVAALYAERVREGHRRPVLSTAHAFNYSSVQMKRLLAKARERGLLTETEQRRAGGELTEKAREILRGEE